MEGGGPALGERPAGEPARPLCKLRSPYNKKRIKTAGMRPPPGAPGRRGRGLLNRVTGGGEHVWEGGAGFGFDFPAWIFVGLF